MRRVFFTVPGTEFEIFSYGFMIMTGFLMAIWVASRRARVVGVEPLLCVDMTVWLLVAGVIGSRLMFVIHFRERIWLPDLPLGQNLIRVVNIRDGGLEFYGGLLAAVPVGVWYLRRHRVPLGRFLDLALPAVTIGLAFGRMGCFLNGCCFGKRCDADGFWGPVAVAYPYVDIDGNEAIPWHSHADKGWIPESESGVPVQGGAVLQGWTEPLIPSQMVSSFANLLLFVLLAWAWARAYRPAPGKARRVRREGEVACYFGIGYAVVRFALELLREDTSPVMLSAVEILGKPGLTISQVVSIGILTASIVFLALLRKGHIGVPIATPPPP